MPQKQPADLPASRSDGPSIKRLAWCLVFGLAVSGSALFQEASAQEAKPQEAKPQEAKPQEAKPQEAKPQEAGPQEVDAVAKGKAAFEEHGCMLCHTVAKGEEWSEVGPNLYGLFLTEPRTRAVMIPGEASPREVRVDKNYFRDSVRKSWDALAVAERGPNKGAAFGAVMPMYSPDLVPDPDLEAIWHYLRTLADEEQAGPSTVMLELPEVEKATSLREIKDEVMVAGRARIFRAPLRGSSGRAVHVGQPNGMSYTFDPRMLSVRKVWGGGFLNLQKERRGRGKPASRIGQGAHVFTESLPLLQPLTAQGEPVDFEFKEPDVLDHAAIERYVWSDRDFSDYSSSLDAEFQGYRLDAGTGEPRFRFRVGSNEFSEHITLETDGRIRIELKGTLQADQRFRVAVEALVDVAAEGGQLRDGVWTLEAGGPMSAVLSARVARAGPVALLPLGAEESLAAQPLVTAPARPGRQPLRVQAGYSVEDWQPPRDVFGREQLFEATGIAAAKDGTIVVATRTAGIWRVRDRQWTLFAEGTYECLGVVIEDDPGDRIVIAQKPELTRISDTDGDGRADQFETVCDDFGFHGNYHEYVHGPVRDKDGSYYFNLNLSHGGNERVSWRAGGPYMGSMGGYRGWACRVTPEGKFELFANGLRSPAGIGMDPRGRLWYAENQGEYVGSSKMVPLEKGRFYGHLSGLISLPGMKPDSPELAFDHWKDKIRKGAVWLPHGKMANSPGHPEWDTTGNKFGPYSGQMYVGDQTLSLLLRVIPEQVSGVDQGCVIPFAGGLRSGIMRLCFLNDGSLLIGQTGRGWGSRGGSKAALQHIRWDGETVPADIHRITSTSTGFRLHFTQPLAPAQATELVGQFKVSSWFYTNTSKYGSPEHDKREDDVVTATIGADRRSVSLHLQGFGEGEGWLDRLYHIRIPDSQKLFGESPAWKGLEGFFTLRAIPEKSVD